MTSKASTLVVLSPGFPRNEADTTCLPAQQLLLRGLRALRPNLRLVVLAFQYPFCSAPYRWHGIDVIPLDGRNRGGLRRLLLWRKAERVLGALMREGPIAGLLSFWYGECAFVAHCFAKREGLLHRCWICGQDARARGWLQRRMRPDAAELVALSDFVRQTFFEHQGIRPTSVVPPGIDPQLFGEEAAEKTIDLLGVGSLIPLKQWPVFLDVVAALKAHHPALCARLVGEGPERHRLQAAIERHGLSDAITLCGALPHPAVLRLMRRSRLLLHPSRYEGFGSVCLEAVAAGMQVISFCRPMDEPIPNWQQASSPGHMLALALTALQRPPLPVPDVFRAKESAAAFLGLFELAGKRHPSPQRSP